MAETIVVIASMRVAEVFRRQVLKVAPKDCLWISPTDPFAIQKLRGHMESRITVYRPFSESAHRDVEDMLLHLGATEIAS